MAIVNIVYPSDINRYDAIVENLRSYVKQYPTTLKLTKVPNADVPTATDHAFGFDIILGLFDSNNNESSLKYFLRNDTGISYTDIPTEKIVIPNPHTMAKFVLMSSSNYDIVSLLERIKLFMVDILEDPSRNEIVRWIRDDIGSWKTKSITFACAKTQNVFTNYGWDENRLRRAATAYSISIDRNCSKDKTKVNKYFLFDRSGYVHTAKGFKKIDKTNKALYIQEDLSLATGWTLIDGKWHLFNNHFFTENITTIDGTLCNLKSFGMLDDDANLYEVDPNDIYKLHRKAGV